MSFIQQFFTSRDNNANAETFVGQQDRLWWDPVTNKIYASDGVTPGGIPVGGGGGGNGEPGGSNTMVQFNNSGSFGGSSNFTYNNSTGVLTIAGNVSAGNFIGNGSALTSLTGANVTGTVANATYATDSAHATVADSANSVTGGNVTGQVANALVAGTVYVGAQPNITSVGTLSTLSVTGNVSGNYFIGNGSLLTGIATSTYGNTDVSAYLASGTDTANIITTGNISGGNILGNLFGTNATLTANTTSGNVFANNVQIGGPGGSGLAWDPAFKVLTFPTDSSYAPAMVATTGTFTQYVNAIWSPSLIGYKFISNGMATAYTQNIGTGSHTWTVYQSGVSGSNLGTVSSNSLSYSYGNLWSQGNITATGNVQGTYILGNGSALTSITGANVTGTVANATYATSAGSATSATTAGTVTTAAQPNITSVGTLSSLSVTGNVTSSANISGSYILGNGSALTSLTGANVTGTVANATYATTAGSTTQLVNGSYSLVLNSNGTMAVPSNLINTGSSPVGFWSTDTVTSYWRSPTGGGAGLPFQSTTAMSNTGVVLTFLTGVANTLVAKSWTFGFNGNLTFPDSTIQSTAFTGTATTAGTVTTAAQPNITSVGTLSSLTVTGNITSVSGLLIGNGSALTSITGANVTGTVANATYATTAGSATTAGTVTTAAQPNITSVGTLSSLTVTANTTSGNLITGGLISATGNITGGNIASNGRLDVAGNISTVANVSGGNVISTGLVSATGNITGNRIAVGAGSATAPSVQFSDDISADTGLYWVSDGNIGVTTNGVLRATFLDTGLSVVGNVTGGNIISNSAVYANAVTAFIAGSNAASGVALQMPNEGALRNLTNGFNNMYFDVSIGGTTHGAFKFRSSSSYTDVLTMSPTGVTFNTDATVTARTASLARTAFNSAIDTEITVDSMRFRISNQGGIFPQVIGNGSSRNLAWTGVGAISGSAVTQLGSTGTIVADNAWTTLYNAHGMDSSGDTVTVTLQDKAAGRIYRITFMRSDNGSTTGYNIIAERLL